MEAIPRLHALDSSLDVSQPIGFCVGPPTAEVPHRPVCSVRLTATGRGISNAMRKLAVPKVEGIVLNSFGGQSDAGIEDNSRHDTICRTTLVEGIVLNSFGGQSDAGIEDNSRHDTICRTTLIELDEPPNMRRASKPQKMF